MERNGFSAIFISVIVLAIVLVAGIWYYQMQKTVSLPQQNGDSQSSSPPISESDSKPTYAIGSSTLVGTSILTDANDGFTLTFPADATVASEQGNGNFYSTSSQERSISIQLSSKLLSEESFTITKADFTGDKCIGFPTFTFNKSGNYDEGLMVSTTTQVINGTTFYVYDNESAFGGSAYEDHYYHAATPYGCYELHTSLEYSDGGDVPQSAIDAAAKKLEAIVGSVEFLL